MRVRLGIDIGGTGIKARLAEGGVALGEWRVSTPRDDPSGRTTIDAVSRIAAAATRVTEPDAIGVVCPGIVDESAGVCVYSANLGWRDLPVRQMVTEALERPVGFGHDVHTAAIVEGVAAGAGPNDVVAFIPLGTGVSAAFTRGPAMLPLGPRAGEIGQYVLTDGPLAGSRIEEICSASGIARRARVDDGETVARLVRAGDDVAMRIWSDAVAALAETIAWIGATLAPRIVILGGGLSRSGDLLLAPVAEAVSARLPELLRPELRTSRYGADSALVGAVRIARGRHD